MKEFLAEYCEKNRKKINPGLFERSFDKPLVDYFIDTFKNLEVLPGVTFDSYDISLIKQRFTQVSIKRISATRRLKTTRGWSGLSVLVNRFMIC